MKYRNAWRKNLKFVLLLLSISMLVIGIANPQVGTKTEKVKRTGIDIVLALDLSKSMLAEDLKPNRLERAKLFISSLLKKLGSDRIALIVFGGNAYLQMPLTVDHGALKLYLNTLNTNLIPTQGTNFTEAIEIAEESFENGESKHNALIIISDGENHDQEALDRAKESGEKGNHIFTVGVGTVKGAPIPVINRYGRRTEYKKDKDGSIILSKLNPSFLQEVADAGNGQMVMLSDGKGAISRLQRGIEEIETKEFEEINYTDYDDQFQFFLLISALCLGLILFIPDGKSKDKSGLDFLKKLEENA